MIVLEHLDIRGFGSIIEGIDITFSDNGVVLIQGENGTGKTTILSAAFWALYGKTLKGKASPEPWESIKPSKFTGTKVSLEFQLNGKNYEIIRCYKYKKDIPGQGKGASNVYFFEEGILYTAYHSKPEQNKYIADKIGMSQDLFKSTILFGQKMKRIIEETGGKQKEVFEEAFNATYISEAKSEINEEIQELVTKISETHNEHDKSKSLYESTKKNYDILKSNYDSFETNRQNEIRDLKTKVNSLDGDIRALDTELEAQKFHQRMVKKITEQIKTRDNKKNEELITVNNNLQKAKTTHQQVKKELSDITSQLSSTKCKTCGQKLPTDFNIKALTKNQEKLTSDLKSSITDIDNHESIITKIHIKFKESTLENDQRKWDDMLKASTKRINIIKQKSPLLNDYKEQITRLENKSNPDKHSELNTVIKTHRRKTKELKLALDEYNKNLDIKKWLIKDPLSNSGLKAFIIREMLKDVNNAVKNYSDVMGFEVEIGIDNNSAKKDLFIAIYKSNETVLYDELSGGQQQLVNLAIAFATHDIISEDCNLLFLDEVYESLDSKNIQKVSELIELKSQHKQVWVITHREEYSPTNAKIIYTSLNPKGQTIISSN